MVTNKLSDPWCFYLSVIARDARPHFCKFGQNLLKNESEWVFEDRDSLISQNKKVQVLFPNKKNPAAGTAKRIEINKKI